MSADWENTYMPSKESSALRDRYKAFADRLAANPGIDIGCRHDPFEGISLLAAESTDVTYDEVTTAGLSAIWANPVSCDTYQCMAGRAPEADASIAEAGKWLRAKLGG